MKRPLCSLPARRSRLRVGGCLCENKIKLKTTLTCTSLLYLQRIGLAIDAFIADDKKSKLIERQEINV
jgi:hypothetical protein